MHNLQKLPHINPEECPPKPTLESECPQAKKEPEPECPPDESSKWANAKNAALLGLLITAATLGAVCNNIFSNFPNDFFLVILRWIL